MNDKTKAILEITAPTSQEFVDKGAIVNQTKGLNGICIEVYLPTKVVEVQKPIAVNEIMQLVDDYGRVCAAVGDHIMPVARKAVLDALQSIQKPINTDSIQDLIAQAEADKEAYPLTWWAGYEYYSKPEGWHVFKKEPSHDIKFFNFRRHPHATHIMQCEQDKIDYPEFYKQLYQVKSLGGNWVDKEHDGFSVEFEYRQHPHRKNIIKFNQCSEADKKRWQCSDKSFKGGEWIDHSYGFQEWEEGIKYRLRPRACFITLQDGTKMEFPEPVREALSFGDMYWCVFMNSVVESVWQNNNENCHKALNAGVVHLTEESAKQHLAALQAANAQVAI